MVMVSPKSKTQDMPPIPANLQRNGAAQPAQPTYEELVATVAALQGQSAEAKAKAERKLTLKVSDKGTITLLGIGSKFDITQYAQK
jgi:hypothetical protein